MEKENYNSKISENTDDKNSIETEKRQSNSSVSLKDLIQNKNYIVVLDTNILLKIYRSSPDYAEYALECLDKIKDYVCLPYNVYWEYEKHRKESFSKKFRSIKNSADDCNKVISTVENKVKVLCNELSKNGYPDIDDLVETLTGKVDELSEHLDSYFVEHKCLDYLNNWDEDKVLNLVNSFLKMPEPSASFIYKQCQEGEQRYKKKTPPGYEDSKKDGVSKYGDLIAWAETYTYASKNNKNIIFVTDDVKEDWWDNEKDGRLLFRKELIKEFSRKTKNIANSRKSLELIPLVSYDLYKAISREYLIAAPDATAMILDGTDDYFIEAIQEDVFDSIWNELAYSGTSYIDEESAHIGSEGVEEWELEDVSFDEFERIDVDSGIASYLISYTISMCGTSYEYWGRDDDTHEVITSPGRNHECSGTVKVLVTREIDDVIDWDDDFEYESAKIEDACIEEDSYEDEDSDSDVYCYECGEKIGYEWESFQRDYQGNPICDSCMVDNGKGFVCPHCGQKYPESMRGGSGMFCQNCENILDV